ncbi:hypothetical protein Swit_4962 (plasmid) [Rhizorhabdus wittichii RW1]|uniref:Uncharacterized protein n=1 Tax=Rhizorhabdus wittichii (strain DSM 6014 / CCUG 31198 / JCM 15750 / NBRC 105917 / EY 4224 / RW1) TaxID=392499 RepID=A0A9J9HH55_RHIWR|nr:hypothetical protein Swit_4962 [Rhizorhabdus wittichii RW1]
MTTSAVLEAPPAPPTIPAAESTAALARRECNEAIDSGSDTAVDVAVNFTLHCAELCLQANPTDPQLRAWHELLRDIAVGLDRGQPELATRLRALAARVHEAVRIATRNPIGVIADRPPARQVLEAIYALGDGSEQSTVRERTGQSQSHFSNMLSLLKGYGLVHSSTSRTSGRNRCLALTDDGRSLLLAARRDGKLPAEIPEPLPEALPRLARSGAVGAGYQPPFPVRAVIHSAGARHLVRA